MMRALLAAAAMHAIGLTMHANAASAWPICQHGQPKAACVHDGDSGWYQHRRIRLVATDAPEIGDPSCPAEYEAGIRARDRLADLLSTGATVHPTGETDYYGRRLVTITVAAGDVETIMLSEGMTLPYRRGARAERVQHWCGG